jgi:hypothetical protein
MRTRALELGDGVEQPLGQLEALQPVGGKLRERQAELLQLETLLLELGLARALERIGVADR